MVRSSRLKTFWDTLIILATFFAAVEIPLRLSLEVPLEGWLLAADWTVTIVFVLDILVNFLTPVKFKGKRITRKSRIAKIYLKGWFTFDLLAAIPFDLIFEGMGMASYPRAFKILRIVRLARLIKLARLNQILSKYQSTSSINPSVLRLVIFAFWIVLIAHWVTCGWLSIGATPSDIPLLSQYIQAMYWTVTTLTTVGYGDISPDLKNNLQIVYTMIVMMLGVGVYGYVIGNIASLLANIDVAKGNFMKKLESVNAFMKFRGVPTRLQQRVIDYYHYLWDSRMSQDESAILGDLPYSLKLDLSMHLNQSLLKKVPLFQGGNDEFIRELVLHLKPEVYLPGDTIVRKGETGDEMFFISKGQVEVVSEDGNTIYATLHAGSFFGEMALVLDQPRTATIRTSDYCDVYTLDKATFNRALAKFPEVKKKIDKTIADRLKATEQEN